MSEPAHSKWSASGFEQCMLCPGSHVLQMGAPRTSSKYADWGTDAHDLAAECLEQGKNASDHLGRVMPLGNVVDDEMVECVQTYIDYVRDVAGDDGHVVVETRVNYSSYLDVPEDEAWGTADAIVFKGDELIVVDLKTGMGVEVSAEKNPQMSLYALGALQAYQGLVADFDRVRMAIVQPRIKRAPSEWDCSVEELEAWGRSTARSAVASCMLAAQTRVDEAWQETFLRPGEKQCKFCKAKATCPALRNEVAVTITNVSPAPASPEEFDGLEIVDAIPVSTADAEWLAAALAKVDLIEDWCKAVRAEAERRLLAGELVPGWKLVQGKKGARQWQDAKVAEETLKAMRVKLEDMYELKLISPTTAEKLHKAGAIGPRQWSRLQDLIVQNEGKPHVAPESDSRPALVVTPVAEEFTDLTADDLA